MRKRLAIFKTKKSLAADIVVTLCPSLNDGCYDRLFDYVHRLCRRHTRRYLEDVWLRAMRPRLDFMNR